MWLTGFDVSSSAEMIPAKSIVMTSRATIGESAINTVPVCTNQGSKTYDLKQGMMQGLLTGRTRLV